MTSDFDIDELERLLAAATPGEWAVCVDATGGTFVAGMTDTAETVCEFGAAPDDDGQEQLDADAALIAAARNSLPAILTEIRELRAENARLKKAATTVRNNMRRGVTGMQARKGWDLVNAALGEPQ